MRQLVTGSKVSGMALSHIIVSKGAEELRHKRKETVHQTGTCTPHQEENDELPLTKDLGETGGGQGGKGRRKEKGEEETRKGNRHACMHICKHTEHTDTHKQTHTPISVL